MKKLTICGRSIAEYAIVLNPIPHPAEKTAADFLQRVIKVTCGVEPPISASAENGICVGTREADPRVKWDGFRITSDDKNVYLDGNIPRGTLYAAYDFAEKYLGYRLFAGDCELISVEGDAVVPAGLDLVDNPAFEVRRSSAKDQMAIPSFAAFCRLNSTLGQDMTAYGGMACDHIDCHTFHLYCNGRDYFEEHPEYFALRDGKRMPCGDNSNLCGQLCLTNPDVIRVVAENALKELRAHPETTLIDISQEDNSNYCQCEHCMAAAEEEESQAGPMIRFINAVAEEIEKEFPNVMVQTFAYEYSTKPPKHTKARENVLVRYCTYDGCYRHAIDDPECEVNRETLYAELKGWQKMCSHMSIWHYSCNFNSYIAPFPDLISLREDHRLFAECHARHVYNQDSTGLKVNGVYHDLKSYLIGKLLWNPYMSVEEYQTHANEFLAAFYGPGWREIRNYIDFEYEMTAGRCFLCKEKVDIAFRKIGIPETLSQMLSRWRNYVAMPYQAVLPDNAFVRFSQHMAEAYGFFDRALAMAETEEQRYRIKRSRFSLTYVELFCSEHDELAMSNEEKAAYLENVEQFYKDKDAYGACYNIHTQQNRNR